MDDIRLLQFRWETKEYGVAVKDVIGITGRSWVNGLANSGDVERIINSQGKPIPILCMQAGFEPGDNKHAIIMHANGIQIVLIVDEIIKITELMDEVVLGATQASFKLWQFTDQVDLLHEAKELSESK